MTRCRYSSNTYKYGISNVQCLASSPKPYGFFERRKPEITTPTITVLTQIEASYSLPVASTLRNLTKPRQSPSLPLQGWSCPCWPPPFQFSIQRHSCFTSSYCNPWRVLLLRSKQGNPVHVSLHGRASTHLFLAPYAYHWGRRSATFFPCFTRRVNVYFSGSLNSQLSIANCGILSQLWHWSAGTGAKMLTVHR